MRLLGIPIITPEPQITDPPNPQPQTLNLEPPTIFQGTPTQRAVLWPSELRPAKRGQEIGVTLNGVLRFISKP